MMKSNIMKRAWEIFRTLTGDYRAKLSMALKRAWAEVKNTITNGRHTFEIVTSIPKNYHIWNIGANMTDGYLPLYEMVDDIHVNTNTLKALKIDGALEISDAMCYAHIGELRGEKATKKLETYVKKYSKSTKKGTLYRVECVKRGLEAMKKLMWD